MKSRGRPKISCAETTEQIRRFASILANADLDSKFETKRKVEDLRKLKEEVEAIFFESRDLILDKQIEKRDRVAAKFGFDYVWAPNREGVSTARKETFYVQGGDYINLEEHFLVELNTGKVICGPFEKMGEIVDDVLPVSNGGDFYLINTKGVRISERFYNLDYDCDNLYSDKLKFPICIYSRDKDLYTSFFLTKTGQKILEGFKLHSDFSDGVAWVKNKENISLIDQTGKILFTLGEEAKFFNEVRQFSDGFALATELEGNNFRLYRIDKGGNITKLDLVTCDKLGTNESGIYSLRDATDYISVICKTSGWSRKVPKDHFVLGISDGIVHIERPAVGGEIPNSDSVGYVNCFQNTEGKPLCGGKGFYAVGDFHEGFVAVTESNEINDPGSFFIDREGKPLCDDKGEIIYFDHLSHFSEGRAPISLASDGRNVLIDTKGNVRGYFSNDITDFEDGVARSVDSDIAPSYIDRYGEDVFGYGGEVIGEVDDQEEDEID
ncbi:MAG: hypothetical protein NTW50_05285 [Candidatus Berkelbacteria bacterium]|nr:hypothetical protein [Candidatus Berkelbacteria bacterium]